MSNNHFSSWRLVALAAGLVLLSQTTQASAQSDPPQSIDCDQPSGAASRACASGQRPTSGTVQSPGAAGTSAAMPGWLQKEANYRDNGGLDRNSNGRGNTIAPPVAPEPLTEFQKLIAATSGQVLPLFGHDLFVGVPSTFAPEDHIPVTPDYVVGPGDEVRIRAWGQVDLSADLSVDRSGDVYIPQVGRIHLSGLPYAALAPHLRSALGRVYRNFDLSVDLGQLRSIQVFVVGQARRPGAYTVSSLSTLVNALFASGGPSTLGTMRDIQVKRDGIVISDFDLYDLLLKGEKSKDVRLLAGDVIFIPAAGSQVALTGSVGKPAIYELKRDRKGAETENTMSQLLEFSGGLSTVASNSRVSIERIEDRQAREAMEVPLDAGGLGTLLRDGDLVRVLPIVPVYQKTVTLRGNLANPGRFSWRPGMKLSDLIPDRASLMTRNYWWRRAQLGLPGAEFQPLIGQLQPMNYSSAAEHIDIAGTAPPMPEELASRMGGSASDSPGSSSRGEVLSAQAETSGGTLAGKQSQIVTQNVTSTGTKIEIALSAPEIDWDYAVIERLNPETLKTSLVPFNLGRLVIDHDPEQNLPLQPGDVVTIFSQADIQVPIDQQTKFIRLEGEFVSAGVYSVGPGETLRQIVARAGGFTPNAYIFGSEFTRESTRVFQQQRIDEFVQMLEMQIQRGAMNLAATAASAQDVASANAANLNQQGLLNKLHQLRATGRIVLEVQPASQGLDSIPAIALQDGDRFVVPSVPATVNVVGAVYNQNSFLYRRGGRVADYLKLAGGPNRVADKKRIFIIRADGSVFSRETANGLWGNNFEALRLNPGDSIILPEKIIGPSAVRNFLNWSQVFSQLALGAAAINVL